MFTQDSLFGSANGPIVIRPTSGKPPLMEAIASTQFQSSAQIVKHGAILFRGFQFDSSAEFDSFVSAFPAPRFEYIFRSSPREWVTDKIHTSTSYPSRLKIPLHNENSYQDSWPLIVAFCCTAVPENGGQTPIASTKAVTETIGRDLTEKFHRLGVEYVRHYHESVDLPWQNVFQTDRRECVEEYCKSNRIAWEWISGNVLRTSHQAQGVAVHPLTKETLFFNQAHLFHSQTLGESQARALSSMFGNDRLPRHARFGDGSEISRQELQQISHAYECNEQVFEWQPGDMLMLDNMQYCHGRRPFEGRRSVFAAFFQSYSEGER